ncbi:Cation efflux family protein [Poriferisphaera corsica]|uniref:Cation efflux family protein n=1 Tax=Poriferisphaera corsica TaxID=2528020 RepID=A0A517YXS6_9BACT|nr:cation transporter [Poriferisphaera corsica]QDU35030.1 Cation efflux family protein [Poriferisphaera corsica]
MSDDKKKREDLVFKVSILGALFFALVGVGWGLAIGSRMILFDGLYSFLGVTLTSVSVYVNRLVRRPEDGRFPFGREQMIPFALSMRSGVLAVLCLYAGTNAVLNLLSGGHEVDAVSGSMYAVLSTVGCFVVWMLLSREHGRIGSDMVKVESHQWLLDTMLSGAVLVGFVFDLLIQGTRLGWLGMYIDSGMVLIACLVFLPMPLQQMVKGCGELLLMGLKHESRTRIEEAVKGALAKYSVSRCVLRATKSGDMVTVELDVILPEDYVVGSVKELDEIRERVAESLRFVEGKLWLSVTFTGDEKWV